MVLAQLIWKKLLPIKLKLISSIFNSFVLMTGPARESSICDLLSKGKIFIKTKINDALTPRRRRPRPEF